MRKFILIIAAILPSAAHADKCEFWFDVAGRVMQDRQHGKPLEAALEAVNSYDLHDRRIARLLTERAYELPRRYTDNAKQAATEQFASAARSACHTE